MSEKRYYFSDKKNIGDKMEKTNCIQKKGWFFDIKENNIKIWHDGRLIKNVTNLKIEMDVEDMMPKAILKITNFNSNIKIKDENCKIIK